MLITGILQICPKPKKQNVDRSHKWYVLHKFNPPPKKFMAVWMQFQLIQQEK